MLLKSRLAASRVRNAESFIDDTVRFFSLSASSVIVRARSTLKSRKRVFLANFRAHRTRKLLINHARKIQIRRKPITRIQGSLYGSGIIVKYRQISIGDSFIRVTVRNKDISLVKRKEFIAFRRVETIRVTESCFVLAACRISLYPRVDCIIFPQRWKKLTNGEKRGGKKRESGKRKSGTHVASADPSANSAIHRYRCDTITIR